MIAILTLSGQAPGEAAAQAADPAADVPRVEAIANGSGAHKLLDPEAEEELLRSLELGPSWVGDFDGMKKRGVVRVLVVPNRTSYFLDGAIQRGATYDTLVEFEKFINGRLEQGHQKIYIAVLPVSRDLLIPALLGGLGDIAAANLTITDERRAQVDFSTPLLSGIRELVISGPAAPPISSLDDLSGEEVWVRETSSFHESLVALDARFRSMGKPPPIIRAADEFLETEDLLEMVNAGVLGITIADSHVAELWSQVFENITVHEDLVVRDGGQIGWMFRQDSPALAAEIDAFIPTVEKGTLTGNIIFKRYLQSTRWVRSASSEEDIERFNATVDFFKTYSSRYDFDYLMMMAQGYQESRLDQSVRSSAGAIGIMQLLPATAADPAVGIPDIEEPELNIHAGIKYMRWIVDEYFAGEDLDPQQQALFAFASYNAGPTHIRRLRTEAEKRGLDPDVWFNNVEAVVAEQIGRETVQYVSNIYKYYLAYSLLVEQQDMRQEAIEETEEE